MPDVHISMCVYICMPRPRGQGSSCYMDDVRVHASTCASVSVHIHKLMHSIGYAVVYGNQKFLVKEIGQGNLVLHMIVRIFNFNGMQIIKFAIHARKLRDFHDTEIEESYDYGQEGVLDVCMCVCMDVRHIHKHKEAVVTIAN